MIGQCLPGVESECCGGYEGRQDQDTGGRESPPDPVSQAVYQDKIMIEQSADHEITIIPVREARQSYLSECLLYSCPNNVFVDQV